MTWLTSWGTAFTRYLSVSEKVAYAKTLITPIQSVRVGVDTMLIDGWFCADEIWGNAKQDQAETRVHLEQED